jgi:anhydro-N-acetylmuramic acid kinase
MAKETKAIWALGAMSGTSLDGVDAAMVLTDGHSVSEFGPHAYRPYTPAEQATLRAALGQWPGDPAVAAAAEVVETAHAELLSRFSGAEVVGFHGQTLAHDPRGRGTHQAGDGNLLAQVLNLPVVWDFRTADVTLGGQGAPLAPFYHFRAGQASWAPPAPLAFLNLGGVGNLTWVDPAQPAPEVPGALLAFDTGPANAPIDDLIRTRLGQSRDEGGRLAANGRVRKDILESFLAHPYFYRIPPKSLDRNDFAGAAAGREIRYRPRPRWPRLTAAAASAVARGAEHFPAAVSRLLGHRRRSPQFATLMRHLVAQVRLPGRAGRVRRPGRRHAGSAGLRLSRRAGDARHGNLVPRHHRRSGRGWRRPDQPALTRIFVENPRPTFPRKIAAGPVRTAPAAASRPNRPPSLPR